ncbi:hypothetical protein BC829DRAFT_43754 [Chytridium lagenaria]|nr:hypothetical protein BC829DRAFT_43754 [Chytridium lagenaria]
MLEQYLPAHNFFLSGEWKKDLNKDNPLGMDGEVAGAYANLVQLIWSVDDNRSSSVPPRHFKSTIGRFNQTFVGYAQQDSQELIQFLLDGLHEDLNRILKKPYIEAPDMDGQPDHVIAEKSWEIYKARNDSAIVDIFQGEYKSRVECLECGRWSVKFDPYMFLSVPVPELREITISIIAVPAFHLASNHEDESTQKPTSLSITVIRDVNIRVLKSKVAEVLGWDSRRMLVVEVFRGRVYKYFRDWDRASELADKGKDEIIIYELSEPDWDLFGVPVKDRDPSKVVHLPIYLAHEVAESENKPYRREEFPAFGYPVFVTIPAEIVVVRRVSPNIAANLQEDSLNQFYLNRLGELLYTEVRRRILMITRSLLVVEQRMKTSEKRDLPIFSLKYYQASEYESHSYGANFYLNPSNRNSTSGYFFPPEEVKVKIPLRRKRRRGEVPETTDVPQSDDDERVDDFDREKLTSSAWTKTDAASGELDDQDDDFYTNEVVVEEVEDGEELVPKHYRMNGDLVVVAQFSAEMVNDVFGEASINDKQLSGCFTPDEKEVPQPEGAPIRRRADQPISLDDCLQEFMKEEHMGEEDTWYCPSCKEHRRIKKKLDIWSVPDVISQFDKF